MSNVFSRFERGVEHAVDSATGAVFKAPIEPAQVAKKAEKQMKHNRLVGAGRQYAPTLYNVLVSATDDKRLFGFYPTMAAEIETYLMAKGAAAGLEFDGRPLVRFIVDDGLKKGKFDVIAENVSAHAIRQLREEEMEYYGITKKPEQREQQPAPQATVVEKPQSPLPAVGAAFPPPAVGAASVPVVAPLIPIASAQADVERDVEPIVEPRTVSEEAEEDRQAALDVLPVEQHDAKDQTATAPPSKGTAIFLDLQTRTPYPLRQRAMLLGRGTDNDIVLADANASRIHARLTQDATGVWKINDLDSTNGTLLNDRPIHQAFLNDGDRVTIGLTSFEFRA